MSCSQREHSGSLFTESLHFMCSMADQWVLISEHTLCSRAWRWPLETWSHVIDFLFRLYFTHSHVVVLWIYIYKKKCRFNQK